MNKTRLKCIKCNKIYDLEANRFSCSSPGHDERFSYLYVEYPFNGIDKFPNKFHRDRYNALLPVNRLKISLGEGNTPLYIMSGYGAKLGLSNVWAKDEGENPTGSFKDRKSVIDINMAAEWGMKKIVNVTSGSAGISLSAYSSSTNINAESILLGSGNSVEKNLIYAHGGTIRYTKKRTNKIVELPKEKETMDCTCGKDPVGVEGYKIIAWEIWEKIGIPDVVVVPCGSGDGLFGIYKGFKELCEMKLTAKIPKMWSVQAEGSETVEKAINAGLDCIILTNGKKNPLAKHISTSYTPSLPLVLHAIKDSKGSVITVSDEEIKIAFKEVLELESINLSYTSASVFAAINKMRTGIHRNPKIVCIITNRQSAYHQPNKKSGFSN